MLKRILPFVLTLIAGIAVWSVISFTGARKNNLLPTYQSTRQADCLLMNHQLNALNQESGSRTECSIRDRSSFANTAKKVQILEKPAAQYTRAARQNRTEGTVRLRVEFGADGYVTNVEPLQSLPDGLTEEAIKAARKIKFNPKTVNGAPVSDRVNLEYIFELN